MIRDFRLIKNFTYLSSIGRLVSIVQTAKGLTLSPETKIEMIEDVRCTYPLNMLEEGQVKLF